jgi:hypothetical protein
MKYFIITFSISVASFSLTSCDQKKVTMVICFVDFSSRDSITIQWYKETIKNSLLRNMPPASRLVVLPIDYNSLTSSTELFKADFSKNEYHNEYAGLQADEVAGQSHQDSISAAIQQFDQVFETAKQDRLQLPEGTDIFGALKQCSKYAVAGQRTLVVLCSDMLEYTDTKNMNFEDHLNSGEEVKQYLANAEKVDLKNMEIFVLTGVQNNMKPEKYTAVKTFWEQYIAQCNGQLIDYSSGAVSKLERFFGQDD